MLSKFSAEALEIVNRFQTLLCFPSCLLRILDNLNDFQFVLDYRAILQSNNDTHRLGDSSTGMYSYAVYLFAVPVILTLVPGTNLFLPLALAFCSCSCCPSFLLCPRWARCNEITFFEDLDVDSETALQQSEWLRANVWIDRLQHGDTCYHPGERPTVLMADVPRLR